MGLILVGCSNATWAENHSGKYQECLGRMTFEVAEAIEWAVFPAKAVGEISNAGGGGYEFSKKVAGTHERGSYDYDRMTFYVSGKVERERFDGAANYIKGTSTLYQKELIKKLKLKNGE